MSGAKNNPMMPIAWTKTYEIPGGKRGPCILLDDRRIGRFDERSGAPFAHQRGVLGLGMEDKIPENGTDVAIVGDYEPTKFEFRKDDYWAKRHMSLDEHRMNDASK